MEFADRLAVVTGGGTGIGRELARQLAARGCHVALGDVSAENMAETLALIAADPAAAGVRATAHVADVADEAQLIAFRVAIARDHATDRVHLLFNNAGVGGGGSLFTDSREAWDRTFAICWGGVYLGVRTFLPMLQRADAGWIVNISSINGIWASLGPLVPHTAYVAAKFAVRGFSEALIADLRVNAPHVGCSVVMPGHVGTPIIANSRRVLNGGGGELSADQELIIARRRVARMGLDPAVYDDAEIMALDAAQQRRFVDRAPTSPVEAAEAILRGVLADQWRILVGPDATVIDAMVRAEPEAAYDVAFFERLVAASGWSQGR